MADSHDHPQAPYFAVFMALCVLTAISIGTEIITFPNQATLIVTIFAVAAAKAGCVLAFFMHLKFERAWKYLLLAPTTILAIGIPLALFPDIALHYYTVDTPQANYYERHGSPHHAAEDGDESHAGGDEHEGGGESADH